MIANYDIVSRAGLLGAANKGKCITITCLGKDFEIEGQGMVASQCRTGAAAEVTLGQFR